MPHVISTEKAPAAIGPYSQAVSANGFIFVSGQIPINQETGQLMSGSVTEQTRCVLNNLSSILEAAGSDLSKVVKTTIYMKDLKHFDELNTAYAEFFPSHKPARACVEVARLPKDVEIEIDAVAI